MGPRQAGSTVERQDRDNTQNRLRFGTETVYDHKNLEKIFCILYIIFFMKNFDLVKNWWIFIDFGGFSLIFVHFH